jgi:hypothetical protein
MLYLTVTSSFIGCRFGVRVSIKNSTIIIELVVELKWQRHEVGS